MTRLIIIELFVVFPTETLNLISITKYHWQWHYEICPVFILYLSELRERDDAHVAKLHK